MDLMYLSNKKQFDKEIAKKFIKEAILYIYGDISHTPKIIDGYINDII